MSTLRLDDARFVDTPDGGRLAYYVTGSGTRAIVWLHGLPLDSRSWSAQQSYFDTRYRNVFIDLRGYGASSKLPDGTTGITALYAADVVHVIETLGLDRPHLVGFASAGHVALRIAAGPTPLSHLAVLNASPRFRQGEDWPHGFSDAAIAHFTEAARTGGIDSLTAAVLDRHLVFGDLDDESAAALAERFGQMSRLAGAQTLLGFFDDISRDDDRALLPLVGVPTLILSSTLGQEVPSGVALYLRTTLASSWLVEIPGADHFAFATRADLVNQLLDSFFPG